MRSQHLALVASYPDGRSRVEHPITSLESVERVYGWLSPLLGSEAVWTVEEVV